VTPSVIQSIATLDRTGAVQAAVSRLALDSVDELEVVRPGDLDDYDVDVDVLIVGHKELTATGLRRIARWRRAHPASVAIAHLNGNLIERSSLQGSGIAQTVRGRLTAGKLRTALDRADLVLWDLFEAADGRSDHEPVVAADVQLVEDSSGGDDAGEPWGGDEVDQIDEVEAEPHTARLITVASATGGCGKTFFATSSATVLAKEGYRVLLVDLDLQFGEVAAALQIHHPYSIYDGLYRTTGERIPPNGFGEHLADLVCHHPLGFDVLTAPRDPVLADYVGARDAGIVLDNVLPHYDLVIVDTPPSLNDVVIAALDRSDIVEVLATPDVPSLRNLTAFTDVLRRLGLHDDRLRLILNKADSDVGVTVAQANEAFDGRFRTVLPVDRAVSRAVNLGTTVPANEPRAKVSRALVPAVHVMAADLGLEAKNPAPQLEPTTNSQRLFSRLWQRVVTGGNA
jgi:MinD-like ATPase involved in chromosome partitioning or flagellar assembly